MNTSQEVQQAVFETLKGIGRFTLDLLKGGAVLAKEVAKITAFFRSWCGSRASQLYSHQMPEVRFC